MAPGGPEGSAQFSELSGAPPAPSGGFGAGSPDPGWGQAPPPPNAPRSVLQLALIGGGIVVFLGALTSAAVIFWVQLRPGVVPEQRRERLPPTLEIPTVARVPTVPVIPTVAPQVEAQMFGAKHLLVMYEGSLRAPDTIVRTKQAARERAAEAHRKAKKGADFAELVREYSDEPGAARRAGDLGTFKKGTMVPAFQEAVEATEVGQISGVVETQFGYHVILRTK